ncbi:hypothetical protein [Diaphorobacter caeni]|uniref:hypothetical protein n=1 Tax=Diaphorobacter caeni TaxID=2784387 RepID=UPI00188DD3FB|nr:hypothetical protein [Diaphorobacter caeni]MBF5005612.1 hypothetical protein [Diaphorobacter caeni]
MSIASSPHRHPLRASRRLGWAGLLLLVIASMVLCGVTYRLLDDLRDESESARSQLLAQSVARRVQHALNVGVPLERLQGMDEFFMHRLKTHPDIQSISLTDAKGQVLWQSRTADRPPSPTATASVPILPGSDTGGAQATPIASLQLALHARNASAFAKDAAILLAPIILLLSALAWLAARYSEAEGSLLRNHVTRLAIRAIRNGRFDSTYTIIERREFDLRVQTLGHATRNVHETLTRVRRLISSLRITEPQQARRERLDHLLRHAEGRDHFAEHGLLQIRVLATQAQAFWICLLLSISAMAMATLSTGDIAATSLQAGLHAWRLPILLASACGGALLARASHWKPFSLLATACATLMGLGAAWACGLLERMHANADLFLMPVVGGLIAGVALQACQRMASQRSNSAIAAAPHWSGAALGAWGVAMAWMAPELAAVTQSAFGERLGAAALALPALHALVLLTQWNVPRSPWRHPSPAQARPTTAFLSPSALAFTAVAMAAVSIDHGDGNGNALQSLARCALGMGLLCGIFTAMPPRRSLMCALAIAAAFETLAHLMAAHMTTQFTLCAVASLALGWCMGSLLKSERRRCESPALHCLLFAGLGAALATLLGSQSLPRITLTLLITAMLGWSLWMLHKRRMRSDSAAVHADTGGEDHAA